MGGILDDDCPSKLAVSGCWNLSLPKIYAKRARQSFFNEVFGMEGWRKFWGFCLVMGEVVGSPGIMLL